MRPLKRLLRCVHAKEKHQESTAGGCYFCPSPPYQLETFINAGRIMLSMCVVDRALSFVSSCSLLQLVLLILYAPSVFSTYVRSFLWSAFFLCYLFVLACFWNSHESWACLTFPVLSLFINLFFILPALAVTTSSLWFSHIYFLYFLQHQSPWLNLNLEVSSPILL